LLHSNKFGSQTPEKQNPRFAGVGFCFTAGSLLQGSNPKNGKNPSNQPSTKEAKNSIRFTEDLVKIYEFNRNYKGEITRILGKTCTSPKQE